DLLKHYFRPAFRFALVGGLHDREDLDRLFRFYRRNASLKEFHDGRDKWHISIKGTRGRFAFFSARQPVKLFVVAKNPLSPAAPGPRYLDAPISSCSSPHALATGSHQGEQRLGSVHSVPN